MVKVAARIPWGDGRSCRRDRRDERLVDPGASAPQQRLDLGERCLDRMEIRGVARQEPETGPARLTRLADLLAVVLAQVVQDHNLTGLEGWSEDAPRRSRVAAAKCGDQCHRVKGARVDPSGVSNYLKSTGWGILGLTASGWR